MRRVGAGTARTRALVTPASEPRVACRSNGAATAGATTGGAAVGGATMGGAGLDISWQSGHMWSLMAESADVASMWVRELNVAIGFTGEPPSRQSTPPASGHVSPATSIDGQSLSSMAPVRG